MPDPVVIWGASGHARVVADALRAAGGFEVVGFVDSLRPERRGEAFAGASVLGGEETLTELRRNGVEQLVVAVGDNRSRLRLAAQALGHGFRLASAVHPRAVVSPDATVGAGCLIAAGAVVGPAAQLGDNVIVNTCASVDHECVIDEGAHLGPGTRLGGRVHVGRLTWLGIGASVRDGLTIGAGSIVGAGAVVLADVPERVVAHGVPARVVRAHEED